MIRRPPRSTRTTHSFPTRRSSDLREALKRTKKVGLGQLTLRGQEQLVALRPCGRGLVLEVLRYADEVNKAANYFRDVGNDKPDADLLDLAETLIDKKRSEERRGGKKCVRTGRSRWVPIQ